MPSASGRSSWMLRLLLATLMLTLAAAVDSDTCFSRQHQQAIVNVRLALNQPGTAMDARVVLSERDCVLACCSEEVKPGSKCNMVVFKANRQASDDNCFLFHCQMEQDCPLTKAQDGINTYDIYKGVIHPTIMRPFTTTITTTRAPPPPTTMQFTATTTQIIMSTRPSTPTETTLQPTTSMPGPPPDNMIATMPAETLEPTKTTTITTTAAMQKRLNKTSKKQNKPSRKGRPRPVSTPAAAPALNSTTSLPVAEVSKEATQRTTEHPKPSPANATHVAMTSTTTSTTTTTTATTTTANPSITTTATTIANPTTTTTTTTTTCPTNTSTSSATTIKPTTTTTSPINPMTTTTTRTTPAANLGILSKGTIQSDPTLQDPSAGRGKAVAARGAVKSSVVAFMILGLAVLTLALAVGGRKAMESFDRRHYTRLELNDLHYEV